MRLYATKHPNKLASLKCDSCGIMAPPIIANNTWYTYEFFNSNSIIGSSFIDDDTLSNSKYTEYYDLCIKCLKEHNEVQSQAIDKIAKKINNIYGDDK